MDAGGRLAGRPPAAAEPGGDRQGTYIYVCVYVSVCMCVYICVYMCAFEYNVYVHYIYIHVYTFLTKPPHAQKPKTPQTDPVLIDWLTSLGPFTTEDRRMLEHWRKFRAEELPAVTARYQVCVCVCMYMYVCIYLCVCVYVCMYVYVCICVCVCVEEDRCMASWSEHH
jgi:hypothetical protein